MCSTDTTLQPQQITSLTAASGRFSVYQQVMEQFTQMRSLLTSFLGQKQETTHSAFGKYLASEVEEHSKQGRRIWLSSQATSTTDTFTQLKCYVNICATDISTAAAASTSCKGIHLNHPRNTDVCKQGHPTPSGNQRTAAANQSEPNFLPSS